MSGPIEAAGYEIARLCSRHTGAAAYVIGRAAASTLLGVEKWSLPVDHLLFNPNNSPVFATLEPSSAYSGGGAPAPRRAPARISKARACRCGGLGWTYIKRELIRFGYENWLLPRQLLRLAAARPSSCASWH